jgi:hypothetical protein
MPPRDASQSQVKKRGPLTVGIATTDKLGGITTSILEYFDVSTILTDM